MSTELPCEQDPELFFTPSREEDAKQLCLRCEVRTECLEVALAGEGYQARQRYGVFGGLGPDERTTEFRRRRRRLRKINKEKEKHDEQQRAAGA